MGIEKREGGGSREEERWGRGFARELKKAGWMAAPMVVATASQYFLQVVSVVMVGHLGQLSLAAVAIATALTNLTGFSLLVTHFLLFNLLKLFLFFLRLCLGLIGLKENFEEIKHNKCHFL